MEKDNPQDCHPAQAVKPEKPRGLLLSVAGAIQKPFHGTATCGVNAMVPNTGTISQTVGAGKAGL
jgi:hypothetical protein